MSALSAPAQPAGNSVSAAIEVPPAAAKAPNQRNDSVIRIQRKKAKLPIQPDETLKDAFAGEQRVAADLVDDGKLQKQAGISKNKNVKPYLAIV